MPRSRKPSRRAPSPCASPARGRPPRIEVVNEDSPAGPGDLADVTAEAEEFRAIGGEIGATGPAGTATYWVTVPLEPGTASAAHA